MSRIPLSTGVETGRFRARGGGADQHGRAEAVPAVEPPSLWRLSTLAVQAACGLAADTLQACQPPYPGSPCVEKSLTLSELLYFVMTRASLLVYVCSARVTLDGGRWTVVDRCLELLLHSLLALQIQPRLSPTICAHGTSTHKAARHRVRSSAPGEAARAR